ncbi:phage tail tape measure protein [Mesonia aquimarina]|uniref:phage tail tape measure protein n=1 Tax=Mesonia aquimarina TaxID=1504967 RepID=UPI000EF5F272|nr:phage tail tape measure protein [Mesonia aquimarina]
MSSFAKISIRFNADLKQFSSQLQNAQKQLNKAGKQMQNVGRNLTLGVTLPVAGLGVAFVKAASDAEETSAKFDTVFSSISESAKESADILRNSYGLSSKASKQLLSDTGDLLTGFGFSQASALDLSTEVNKLAVDLASFTNYSGGAEGASQALTKALLGERESVKSLGISILEADVKARVLQNTQQGLTFETERQAKAFATLQLAQEQSKNAIGDYARTSDGFANQMRLIKARLNDLAVQFGEIILPYVQKLATFVTSLIEKFSSLDKNTKKIIVVVAGLAAALGPVLLALGTLATTILPALASGFAILTGPVGLVIAALTAVGVIIYKYWEPIKATLIDLANYFIDLYNESIAFRVIVESIILTFKTLFEVGKLIFNGLLTLLEHVGENIKSIFGTIGEVFKAVLTGNISEIPKILNKGLLETGKNFGGFLDGIQKDYEKFSKNLDNNLKDSLDRVQQKEKIELVAKATVDEVDVSKVNPIDQDTPVSTGGGKAREQVSTVSSLSMRGLPSPLEELADSVPEQADYVKNGLEEVIIKMQRLSEVGRIVGDEVAGSFENFTGRFLDALDLANTGMQGFLKNMAKTVTELISMLLSQAVANAIASGTQSALFTGPGAVIAQPAFIATAVGGVLSAFASIPKFADGGIVNGPTVGLMGEYSGAKTNPEVIAPLDKLRGMIADVNGDSGSGYIAETSIRGEDIRVALLRTEKSRSRRT